MWRQAQNVSTHMLRERMWQERSVQAPPTKMCELRRKSYGNLDEVPLRPVGTLSEKKQLPSLQTMEEKKGKGKAVEVEEILSSEAARPGPRLRRAPRQTGPTQ